MRYTLHDGIGFFEGVPPDAASLGPVRVEVGGFFVAPNSGRWTTSSASWPGS